MDLPSTFRWQFSNSPDERGIPRRQINARNPSVVPAEMSTAIGWRWKTDRNECMNLTLTVQLHRRFGDGTSSQVKSVLGAEMIRLAGEDVTNSGSFRLLL